MSYQPLFDEEIFGLYEAVSARLSVPMCVYDNPGTTHFQFSDELHGRIAALPKVASIKIPGVPEAPDAALAITRAAQGGKADEAIRLSQRLEPLWALFRLHGGSLRVVATTANLMGFVTPPLPAAAT